MAERELPQRDELEKRLILRPLTIADHDQVTALQIRCFPNMRPWSREQLGSHVRLFPEGQMALSTAGCSSRLPVACCSISACTTAFMPGRTSPIRG